MPNRFQQLVDEYLTPHVDRHFGEPFTLRPMITPPNGRPTADPDRAIVNAIGVVHQASREAGIEVGNRNGSGNDFRNLLNLPGYDILIDRRHLPQSPRQGDEVEVRGETYQVTDVQFDGVSRWELRLIQ